MKKDSFFDVMENGDLSKINNLKFDSDGVVVFQHIGKTAGVSLSVMLRKNIKPWYIVQWFRQEASWKECLVNLDEKGYKLVGGHISGKEISKFPFKQKKGSLITMIRNPVNRMISQYYQGIKKDNPAREKFMEKYKSLESYIEAQPENLMLTKWLTDQKMTSYEETLDRIKERYAFIGVTEYSDHSVWILSKLLGISYAPLEKRNKNENKEYTSDRERVFEDNRIVSMIEEKSHLDIKIFRYILNLYKTNASNIDKYIRQDQK